MRYHSPAVIRSSLPDCLEVTSETADGEIMGIRHNKYPTEGTQHLLESIMTSVGKRILKNFVQQVK